MAGAAHAQTLEACVATAVMTYLPRQLGRSRSGTQGAGTVLGCPLSKRGRSCWMGLEGHESRTRSSQQGTDGSPPRHCCSCCMSCSGLGDRGKVRKCRRSIQGMRSRRCQQGRSALHFPGSLRREHGRFQTGSCNSVAVSRQQLELQYGR
jgi:hypothetical protein